MQYYCQACLKTGDNVTPMSVEEINAYREFICKNIYQLDATMHICVYCKYVLKKLRRFVRQCEVAQMLLKEMDQQDTKQLLQPTPAYNFKVTQTSILYMGPDTSDVKMEDGADGYATDEDDIPLVMLGSNGSLGGDRNEEFEGKLIKVETEQMQDATEDSESKYLKKKKHKKKKKELREGFTSRMVQETNEYLVIKLTKEQVLQEMEANSTTERYRMSPYKCEKCVKGFNFEDVLQSHMEKHSPKNGPLQCEICTQYCASTVSLRGHMKSHTTRYKCKVCALVRLSRQHVLEHYGIAHGAAAAAYRCERCAFTTNKRTVIQHHVKTHMDREPHACHQCGKLYKNLETLRIHITRHESSRRHQCEHCRLSFVYASQLRAHVRSVHERRDYYCVECDVMFKSMKTLNLHFQKAKRHRDASSYKYPCTQCEQRFVSPSTLATHLTSAHGTPKREACGACARAYSSRDALRVHMRSAHARARSQACCVCERAFSRKGVLAVHMRTHTGERPHACVCGAAFAQRATLRAHQAAKHKKSEDQKEESEATF